MRSTAYAHNFALYDAMLTLYMLSADLLCVIDGLHCGPTSAGDAPSLLSWRKGGATTGHPTSHDHNSPGTTPRALFGEPVAD